MRVHVDIADIEAPGWEADLAAYAERILSWLGAGDWILSVVLCSDPFIQDLNLRYRKKNEPTDVLSFEMGEQVEGEGGIAFLAGDIVISLPAVERNARDFGVSRDEELRRLVVHGILHLSGMDHENNDPSNPMLLRQEELLRQMGGRILP